MKNCESLENNAYIENLPKYKMGKRENKNYKSKIKACKKWNRSTLIKCVGVLFALFIGLNAKVFAATYDIGTATDFINFTNQVSTRKTYAGDTVNITADINLNNTALTPMNGFAGTLDGKGHTISGIKIECRENYSNPQMWYGGLFGIIDASPTIKNLTLAGTIDNQNTGDGSYISCTGAFAAYVTGSPKFENCVNAVNVFGKRNAGGFIGYIESKGNPTINNCYNVGPIYCSGASSPYSNNTGGFIGVCYGNCTLNNVFNMGAISSDAYILRVGRTSACNGGLIGYLAGSATIKNSYNGGRVSGGGAMMNTAARAPKIGAICGQGSNLQIQNCYYLDSSADNAFGDGSNNSGVTSKTETELKATNMPGLLGSAWTRDSKYNNGYPILIGVNSNPPQLILNINTVSEFKTFANSVNSSNRYQGYTVNILSDINMNNATMKPIGDFYGVLDGHGHTISGLNISSEYNDITEESYGGLFGVLTSGTTVIKNLTISGEIGRGSNTGGFAGFVLNSPTFENCANLTNITNGDSVGGFIGYIEQYSSPKIYNCYNAGNISGSGPSSYGGIIGTNYGNCVLNNVYNVGNISGEAGVSSRNGIPLGGLIGAANGNITLKNSYNAGIVKAVNYESKFRIGAICGSGTANIENVYYLDTSANSSIGTKVTDAELKATDMPGKLNASQNPKPWFRKDNVNNGWPILKMGIETPEMTVSPTSLSIVYGSSGTITYTYNGDGTISAVSSATTTCTVAINTATKTVTVTSVAVGSAVVTISAPETDSYEAISKTVNVTVTRKPISVPTAIAGLVYNGKEQTGVNSGTGYTITGNTGTNAGSYTAKATPTANYMWTDNTYVEKSIAWSIARQGIAKPTASNKTYNRAEQTGVPAGTGYTLEGTPKATNQGSYNVTVKLNSNYQWTDNGTNTTSNLTLSWTMNRKNIADSDVTRNIPTTAKTYNGSAQTQTISLTHAGATLNNPKEYTVSYSDNTNAGTATITVTGVGNYTGTVTSTFTINRLGIKKPVPANKTYNRAEQTGVSTGTGYTLEGTPKATNQGTYSVTVKLDPNYQWSDNGNSPTSNLTLSWTMNRKDISEADVIKTIGTETKTYNGNPQTQTISLAHVGATLQLSTEYTVAYSDNTNAGQVTITITGVGNYTGTVTRYFTIDRLGINKPVKTDRTYNRVEQTGVPTGTGYKLEGTPKATNQGTYSVTVKLDPNYKWTDNGNSPTSDVTLSWIMYKKDIGDNDVGKTIGAETRTYNGSAHTQTISLSHAGATLNNQTEYSVEYSDNINAGTVTITITGIGNYTGKVTSTFVINRTNQTITLSDKVVDYNPNNVPVPIGDAVVTGVNGTVLKVGVTYTYYTNSECTTLTTTSDGATGSGQAPAYVGVYYVKASVEQSQNYFATSKTVKLTINKIGNTLVVTGVPNLRYIEAPQNLVTVSNPQGDVYYLIGNTPLNSSNYTTGTLRNTIPQGTDAGTYVVQYYTPGNRNYKEKTGSVTVIIIDTYYKDNASPVKYYISLQEAFSQIETNKTLLVMKNVTDNNQAILTENKTVVLDLNGKTITTNVADSFIVNQGNLTIKDGPNAGGKIYSKSAVTLRLVNIGNTFTMESGTLAMDQIDDGSQFPSTLLINAGATAYVRDGATISANRTEHLDAITLSVFVASGKLVMTGGNIVATKSVYGNTTAIINQAAYGNAKIEISGGSVTSNNGNAIDLVDHVANFGGQYNESSIKISGNARIEGKANGIFNNKAIGGITIDGATIIGGETGIYQTVNCPITIKNASITGTQNGITMQQGNLTVDNSTIVGTNGDGIYKTSGSLVIGTKGGEPSIITPLIQGKNYGIETTNGFEFYDGILKGQVDAFSGNVTPETGYIIHYGAEVINGAQYKTATLIRDTIEIPASGKPVITEWTVPAKVDSNALTTTVKIPIPQNTKAYKVDWGDSVVEYVDAGVGFKEHLYKNTAQQTYTVKASGYIDSFGYYGDVVPTKDNIYNDYYTFTQYVTALRDWGIIDANRYGFSNCIRLNSAIPSLKRVSFQKITDVSFLFNNCSALDIELQKDLFSDCTQLQYFNSAFNGCSKIKGTVPRELFASNEDVRKIARLFKGCSSLVGADIEIDSSNVTTMDEMFNGCTNIKTIVFEDKFKDLVGIKMFEGCNNLKSTVMLYEYSG